MSSVEVWKLRDRRTTTAMQEIDDSHDTKATAKRSKPSRNISHPSRYTSRRVPAGAGNQSISNNHQQVECRHELQTQNEFIPQHCHSVKNTPNVLLNTSSNMNDNNLAKNGSFGSSLHHQTFPTSSSETLEPEPLDLGFLSHGHWNDISNNISHQGQLLDSFKDSKVPQLEPSVLGQSNTSTAATLSILRQVPMLEENTIFPSLPGDSTSTIQQQQTEPHQRYLSMRSCIQPHPPTLNPLRYHAGGTGYNRGLIAANSQIGIPSVGFTSTGHYTMERVAKNLPICVRNRSLVQPRITAPFQNNGPTSKVDNIVSKERGYQSTQGKYHDHVTNPVTFEETRKRKGNGGITVLFPVRLQHMLDSAEDDGFADIISWQPHGRAFKIHNRKRFTEEVLPQFFKQSMFSSFSRQLRMYDFSWISCRGPDKGAYYHEACLRGMPALAARIQKLPKDNARSYSKLDFSNMPPAPSPKKTESAQIKSAEIQKY